MGAGSPAAPRGLQPQLHLGLWLPAGALGAGLGDLQPKCKDRSSAAAAWLEQNSSQGCALGTCSEFCLSGRAGGLSTACTWKDCTAGQGGLLRALCFRQESIEWDRKGELDQGKVLWRCTLKPWTYL